MTGMSPVELLNVPGRAPNPLYHAVSVAEGARSIAIAGQVGDDAEGNLVGDDLAAQTAQALRSVHGALAAADAGPEHLTSITVYVVGWREELMPALVEGMQAGGEAPPVPATLIGVQSLFAPGYLVEVVATAVA